MTAMMRPVSLSFAGLAAAGLALAAPAPVQAQGRGGAGRPGQSYANPSAVIAAELALAKDGRERGQWAALADAAAPEAVLLTGGVGAPGLVWAQQWFRGRSQILPGGTREPYEVWSSCDGSLVVSRGAWRHEGRTGSFAAIWQHQGDGKYRWLIEQDLASRAGPAEPPEMIVARVADCPERARAALGKDGKPAKPEKSKPVKAKDLPPLDPKGRAGRAADGSLSWEMTVQPAGEWRLLARWKHQGGEETILDEKVAG
ncbi:hypothetical protein H7F51_14765 [Novosphingobium flavum]|uniref:DUF4440 domain-containing protein n=1 Tax=Novosphingobium flavum TaxID=1778672 RepID=A0A7X1KMM2_9SPHN|nr:hypothetical protein [Novosphingobium flavum]MBC2666779.1 hypothetical protein [Novosphingobium flavum]